MGPTPPVTLCPILRLEFLILLHKQEEARRRVGLISPVVPPTVKSAGDLEWGLRESPWAIEVLRGYSLRVISSF